MPANEKRGYVMMSDFWQYIAEYTIADFSIECSYFHSNAFVHFFYWKNVVFAQSNKCCELCKTKCQPMRSVMWWRRISNSISQNIPSQIFFVIQSDSQPWWLSWILNRPGGREFKPRRGLQHSFVEIDDEIFSTVILYLLLIQEGQMSVSGERMFTILVNRLED